MPSIPDPKDLNQSLLGAQAAAAARQALLEKMRGRLSAPSTASVAFAERRRNPAVRNKKAWAWGIFLVAAFLGLNLLIAGVREKAVAAAPKTLRSLAIGAPKNLPLNEQALYWTYALYDFDRLKARFGVASHAIVSAGEAKRRLAELMPKVDERTKFAIRKYLPAPRGGA